MRLRRERAAPPVEMREGLCPFCRPGDPFPCERCPDSQVIRFPASFSKEDDAKLRELVESCRPWPYVAVELARPEAVVYARAMSLGIKSPRPEPGAYIIIRASRDPDAPAVDIHDPTLHDEAVRP